MNSANNNHATDRISVAVLGASGYTGAELLRFLLQHPYVYISALSAHSQAGKMLQEVYPHLTPYDLPDLVSADEIDWKDIQLAFCCLPHATTQEVVSGLPEHVRVIDLSADFRLQDVAEYQQWYGREHAAPELQKQAVYGLSEHAAEAIKHARLVANPGCYPTAAQLPLLPLLTAGLIESDGIIIDAKSGVTGAGRAAKTNLLFTELDGGMNAYGIGKHRHLPEIEQGLSKAANKNVNVRFTPHLIPMNRGILATIYVRLAGGVKVDALKACWNKEYKDAPFVHVLPGETYPATQMVRGSNHCLMNAFADRLDGHAIIVSVIDNLVKGASGQAVQNFNIMHGFDPLLGLQGAALFP